MPNQHAIRNGIGVVRGLLATILLCLIPLAVMAQVDLLQPIHNIALKAPPDPPPPGGPKFYSWTGPDPNWSVDQWNIPDGALSPFTAQIVDGDTVYYSSAPEASVKIIQGRQGTQIDLAQNGEVLPCMTASGNPRESDLQFGANSPPVPFPGVSGMTLHGKDNPPLSAMSSLQFRVNLAITEGVAANTNQCGVSQGSVLLGVILSDTQIHPGQTLFYKLIFDRLCGIQPEAREQLCRHEPDSPQFYFRKNPYGVSDFLPLLNMPLMSGTENREYDFDLLPRLIRVVQTAPPGSDHDLSHWVVSNVYVGQAIWGGVTLRSNWRNISLLMMLNSK